MKYKVLSVFIALAMLFVTAGSVFADSWHTNDPEVLKDLAKVRKATAKYHDVEQAIADGYVADPVCVPGMGFHYINYDLLMNPTPDLTQPEILLYVPSENGMKLVGVEYMLPIGGPDEDIPDSPPPAPVLFGVPYDGPMIGHGQGQPPHYDLHVWVWHPNPDGMFAMFNQQVSCP